MQTDFQLNVSANSEPFPLSSNFTDDRPLQFPSLSSSNPMVQNQPNIIQPIIPLSPFPRMAQSRLVVSKVPKLQEQASQSPSSSNVNSSRTEHVFPKLSALPMLKVPTTEIAGLSRESDVSSFPSFSQPNQPRLNPTMLKNIIPARRMGSQLSRLPRPTFTPVTVDA